MPRLRSDCAALGAMAAPLAGAQLAMALNASVANWCLAKWSPAAFHAALPASMLAVAAGAFATSTLAYSGTLFARRHGRGDDEGAASVFLSALRLVLFSVPYFLLAAPAGFAVLAFFSADAEVLREGRAYYCALLGNGFLACLCSVLNGHFTGQGKTRLVGAATVLGYAANMALSPVFVPRWGALGAGLAATAAHLLPAAAVAGAAAARPLGAKGRANWRDVREILRLGLPNGFRSLVDIGVFFAFTAVLSGCSRGAAAASTAAFAVAGVFQAFPQGLSQALEVAVARSGRAMAKGAFLLAGGALAAYCGALWAWGGGALGAFMPEGGAEFKAEFAAAAALLVPLLAVKAAGESAVAVLQAELKGRGRTLDVFRVQTVSALFFWAPLFALVRLAGGGVPHLWATMAACSFFSSACLWRRLRA